MEARIPKNHRVVLEVVQAQGRGRHLTTSDVYALAKERQPSIGATTVYRALSRLKELGFVAEILVPGAEHTYYETAAERHAHFQCAVCGHIADVDYTISRADLAGIADVLGARVDDALVNLRGRCGDCR